ncbi:MAG TPA: DUF6278 family protein [Polyangiales bacterium]
MIAKFLLQSAYMVSAAEQDTPAKIAEWAATCVKFVKEALKLELDYTPETLPVLDHYVRAAAGDPAQEVRALLTPPLGAYFGEVVRRQMSGARWHVPDDDYPAYRLEFDGFFLHFNPLGVAVEVLSSDDAEGFGAHFQILDEARGAVEEALQRSASVSVDDYYSFTIRYETLELVTSVLAGLESLHRQPPRRFGPEVYRAAAGERVGTGELS